MADDSDGFRDGLESSQGDPRVLAAMNLVLSTAFALAVVWGASVAGMLEFGPAPVLALALVLVALTHLVT